MHNTFDSTAKTINRATICDGKLLDYYVFKPLSSNDNTLLSNINEIYPYVTVYKTVYDNSATNYDNSKVSGFSAIYCNTTANVGASYIASTLKFTSSDYVDVNVDPSHNTLEIEAKLEEFAKSYYARAMYAGAHVDSNSVAFNNSSATNHGFVFGRKSYADSHGVVFSRGPSTATDFGVVFSLGDYPYNTGVATHSSVSLYGSKAYGKSNIVAYKAYTDDSTVSSLVMYESSATKASCGIAKYTSKIEGAQSIAEYDSYASAYSIAMHNSTAHTSGIALYDATASNNSVALCNAEASDYSIGYDTATASTSSVAMKKNSQATNQSIAFLAGTATNKSIAIGKAYADDSSINISLTNNIVNRPQATDHSIALGECYTAKNHSIGLGPGIAEDHSFEILGRAWTSSWALSYASATDCSFAALTGASACVSSIAMLGATATDKSFGFNGGEAHNCSISIDHSIANNYSVAKFTSTASNSAIAYCYSSATNKSLAMFDSSADDCSIALFNSTAAHSALSLYDNTINIKSDGSLNGVHITDVNGELYVD